VAPAPSDLLTEFASLYRSKREEIRSLHTAGVSGHRIVESLSDLTDFIIIKAAPLISPVPLRAWGGTLVAIGGYGRRELSPASDIDLMFLTSVGRMKEAKAFAAGLLCLLWDLGLKVGHSLRSIDDCVKTARHDTIIATSMLEARYLAGDRDLFHHFYETFFSKIVSKNLQVFLQKVNSNKEDVGPYLSEPNIKTSPGGLRDIHRMKWVALPRYRTNSLSKLYQLGRLTTLEYQGLTEARNFLWRIRNELHFRNTDDQLTTERQEEIAAFTHFESRREFMRHYYRMAGTIADVTSSFIRVATPKTPWQRFVARFQKKRIDPDFYLSQDALFPSVSNLDQFFEQDENLLRLFLVAKDHKKIIHSSVMEVLQQLKVYSGEAPALSPQSGEIFRRLLSKPGGITATLRIMHQTRVLWRIIPEFSRIDCLMQESRSHFFTTDEHTFRAISAAEQLLHEPGPIGKIYAEIQRKDILHLALLLHDIGKGQGEDHSAYGAAVANAVSHRLGYVEEECTLLTFLVHQHLLFSEVAFYRDFTNEPILLTFARAVGRPETLKMLLVLTCSDIQAVAPGMLTSWKEEMLLKLYDEALVILSGEGMETTGIEIIRSRLHEASRGKYPEVWHADVARALNPRYLAVTPLEKIKGDISALFRLLTEPIQVVARYDDDRKTTEYTLYTIDVPGLFLTMTGVLAARGLSILGAQVFTHDNGMVVDTFSVEDPNTHGPPPPKWIEAISQDMKRVLGGVETIEALFKKGQRYPHGAARAGTSLPAQVEVDNESSHLFTIIDIFAPDLSGLLYKIAKILFDLGLSVHSAKISTRLDQIVDVFYVQGPSLVKITDPEEIQKIKSRLTEAIELAVRSVAA